MIDPVSRNVFNFVFPLVAWALISASIAHSFRYGTELENRTENPNL